ncbi:MAG TPA: hypothetical protein PK530_06920 [Anaerolineales bacterium]|nr:hypothetical protein [Anaerolineales bacterium]
MSLLPLLSFFLIALLLMTMFAKVRPWAKVQTPGKVLKTIPMGWRARVQVHRSTLMALGFVILFGTGTGWLATPLAFMIGAFSLAMLFIPMRYTFTSQGVAIGEAMFRGWDEFTGIRTLSNRVELQHPQWLGRLSLFVNPQEMEPMLKKIKKF